MTQGIYAVSPTLLIRSSWFFCQKMRLWLLDLP